MCGICGFANYRNDDLLKGMASRLAHRGPDEEVKPKTVKTA